MRLRTVHTVPVLAASAALLLAAQPGQAAEGHQAAPARCAAKALTIRAKAVPGETTVVRFSVTNGGSRACVVDRVPTITFGDLDGAALPTPEGGRGTYRLAAGKTAHGAVRTIGDPADPEARRSTSLGVAASASQWGGSFSAAKLGTGRYIRVWEPVTTWWQPTRAKADKAIRLG
ncbi:DUF4232 domain-containing protein [Streptomyces sp. NPDC048201]|uniref:DUF4232 domain-containing protein n=1 Tax=Streptomyces sp. NPDC048201 TaxID=3365513 RepID=UPI00371F67D3